MARYFLRFGEPASEKDNESLISDPKLAFLYQFMRLLCFSNFLSNNSLKIQQLGTHDMEIRWIN